MKIATNADVSLTSNSERSLITGSLSGYGVSLGGTGALSISNLDIVCHSPNVAMSGLSVDGAGTVNLDGVKIEAVSEKGYARGISVNAAKATVIANGGSISASTNTVGVIAYGVATSNQTDSVYLTGCPIDVESVSGNAGGFYGRGSFSLRPDASGNGSSIRVRTLGVAANAWGVNMASVVGSVSKAVLEDASISVVSDADASASEYWCLMSGDAVPSKSVEWTFEGETLSLVSANGTHIGQYGVAAKIAPGLQVQGPVTLFSANLEDNVALKPTEPGDLQALASCFEAAEGSTYDGWSLGPALEGSLSWQHDDVVANATSGKGYNTLQQALDEASSGDRLVLVDDCSVEGPLGIAMPLSLDVSGHVLKVRGESANATSAGTGGALVYSGEGTLALNDSSVGASGRIVLSLGRDFENATTASSAYQGISVCNGGALKVDGVRIEAVYNGTTSSYPEVGLRAVGVQNGSVSLVNGACVVARASEQGAAFGACDTVGVYLYGENPSKDEPALSVDASSSIRVEGDAPSFEKGTLLHSASLEVARYDSYDLRRIEVDEDSELYQQILEKFREVAKFDSSLEDSSVFDSGIYYAVPLIFEDGVYIWAYSEPCKAGKVGERESIVPKLLFTQSKHLVVGNATGVSGETGFSGTVDVKGHIEAVSSEGDALCLSDDGAGTWKLGGSTLNAAGGQGSRDVVLDALDLRDYLDLPSQSSRMSYPSGARQKVVSARVARSYGICVEDGASQAVFEGNPTITVSGADAQQVVKGCSISAEAVKVASFDDIRAGGGPVTVRFANLRAADGSPLPDSVASVDYGGSIDVSSAPQQGAFTKGGSMFKFVGWSPTTDVVIDPADMGSLAFDASIAGAVSGNVVLSAVYVEVGPGQRLVTFKVDDRLTAYAEDVGATPSYAAANAGTARHIPSKVDQLRGHVAIFRGWRIGWYGSSDAAAGGECIAGALPAVSDDALYTAVFDQEPGLREMAFCYWKANEGGAAYTTTGYLDLPYGSDPGLVAQNYAKLGDCVNDGDVTYVFEGWSVRKSDKQPVYVEQLPPVDLEGSDIKEVYYGIYSLSGVLYDVNFIVDGNVLASLTSTKGTQTIDSAFRATGAKTPDAPKGMRFIGWGLSKEDVKQLSGAIVTVADAYGRSGASDNVLNLYALFGKKGESIAPAETPGTTTEPTKNEDKPDPANKPSDGDEPQKTPGDANDGKNDGEKEKGEEGGEKAPKDEEASSGSAPAAQTPAAKPISGGASAIALGAGGGAVAKAASGTSAVGSAFANAKKDAGKAAGAEGEAGQLGEQEDAALGAGSNSENAPAFYLSVAALAVLIGFASWALINGRRKRRAEDLAEDVADPASTKGEYVSF